MLYPNGSVPWEEADPDNWQVPGSVQRSIAPLFPDQLSIVFTRYKLVLVYDRKFSA